MINETYEEAHPKDLLLDPQSPRLKRNDAPGPRTQSEIRNEYNRCFGLLPLARSIAKRGYMPLKQNALLALAESNGTGAYTILDGNRRLATLQLLGNSNFRQEAGMPKDSEWNALAKEAKVYMFDSIPLLVYTSRRDVEHHLAYTHIPGPTPWLQSARARYMAALLAREDDPADPADRIGVNPRTLRRHTEAHHVHVQAIDTNALKNPADAAFTFLYQALEYVPVRLYLGLDEKLPRLPEPYPVPNHHLDNLRNLMQFIVGDKAQDIQPVLWNTKELASLSTVLESQEATESLLKYRSLSSALRLTLSRDAVVSSLQGVRHQLAEAHGRSLQVPGDEKVKTEIKRLSQLVANMELNHGLSSH